MEYVTAADQPRESVVSAVHGRRMPDRGFWNKAYDGIYLEKGKTYTVRFYARAAQYPEGNITGTGHKGRQNLCAGRGFLHPCAEKTWQKWNLYEAVLEAGETIRERQIYDQPDKARHGRVRFDFHDAGRCGGRCVPQRSV